LGLFVVPIGELESWMLLECPKGKKWNRMALDELHSKKCPDQLLIFIKSILEHLKIK
jgi:hypothetical protein